MHGNLTCKFQVMNTPFQIVPRGAQITQFLGLHDLFRFWCGLYRGFFGGNDIGIQITQLFFTRRDVKRQFIIKFQRFFIKKIKRFDIL